MRVFDFLNQSNEQIRRRVNARAAGGGGIIYRKDDLHTVFDVGGAVAEAGGPGDSGLGLKMVGRQRRRLVLGVVGGGGHVAGGGAHRESRRGRLRVRRLHLVVLFMNVWVLWIHDCNYLPLKT